MDTIEKVIPNWLLNNIRERHKHVTTREEATMLTDEQLLKVSMFGPKRVFRLRNLSRLTKAIPNRAHCDSCGGIIKIEYHVDDEVWYEAVPRHLNSSRICLNCLMLWADEKFLPWDKTISLAPISFFTQRKIQENVERGIYTDEEHKWHVPMPKAQLTTPPQTQLAQEP